MPYITSVERVWHARGLRKGIKSVLNLKFGADGLQLMPEIEQVYDEEQLETILNAIGATSTLEEARRLWKAEETK